MKDTRVITGFGLVVCTLILSTIFMTGTVGAVAVPSGMDQIPAFPTQEFGESTTPAAAPVAVPTTSTVPTATDSTSTISPSYPTTVSGILSSEVTTITQSRPKAIGVLTGQGNGHAYGVFNRMVNITKTLIVDTVTVTALNGTMVGHMDTITFQAYYNAAATPYCTRSTVFDATGLVSYTTSFSCDYLGAGTYNFKVTVFDDYGTVIGDPETSMAL